MKELVVLAGAAIVVGSTGVAGLRLQKALERHAPSLAALLPDGWAPVLGFLVGATIVAGWI